MTLVEVLAAMFVLTVGIIGTVSAFDSSRKLTLTAERRQSIAHLAQRELERLQSVTYSQLYMSSAPSHFSESTNPDYYVDYSTPVKCTEVEKGGCFAPNTESTTEEEALAIAPKSKGECKSLSEEECGKVSPNPVGRPCAENPVGSCEWTDGRLKGDIYDFITWHYDTVCKQEVKVGEKRCSEQSYKRATVVVTVSVPSGTHAVTPTRASTLIADPKAVDPNPNASPGTVCGEKPCTSGIGKGDARSWFLHDSSAQEDEEKKEVPTPSKANKTDSTVAASNTEPCTKTKWNSCPRPDLMDATSPSAATLYDYSSDQDTACSPLTCYTDGTSAYGGRRLLRGLECSEEPTSTEAEANFKNEMWVTEPLSKETKLTAAGGLSIYTQAVNGLSGEKVTLCLAIYSVPKEIKDLWGEGNLATENPTLLAYTSYAPTEWPKVMEAVTFAFEPSGSSKLLEPKTGFTIEAGKLAIAAEHRIGVRIWPAKISTSDISIAYDTAAQPSILQLNTEE